jgi:POT family proton-dependent oligopeptide transporter
MSYLTRPVNQKDMPAGIPYIIGNEAAERFSFYGMRTILVVFMTQYLMGNSGLLEPMGDEDAKAWYHLFVSAVYFTPLLGAVLADVWLGKYRTILFLSLVYCAGHLALALDDTRIGLAIGLGLIAIGAGGIKPCVSAHVGDQFGHGNRALISRTFGWFYMAINVGAFISTLLTPWLLKHYGAHWAFGVPGVLMALATLMFWMGRNKFVHIPPSGRAFLTEVMSRDSLRVFGRLLLIYLFIAVFWSLYDQTGSSWVLQAQQMDRVLLGVELLPSQIQALNPLLIIVLIPLYSYVIYPFLGKIMKLTPVRKVAMGFLLAAAAFAVSSLAQERIDAGVTPSISWQLFAYVLLTAGEVMVSITALEYSYTQAPRTMKSFVMALFLLSVSLGNIFTSGVNFFIQNGDGSVMLEGAEYYWFFTGLMAVTTVIFALLTPFIKDKTILQESATDA